MTVRIASVWCVACLAVAPSLPAAGSPTPPADPPPAAAASDPAPQGAADAAAVEPPDSVPPPAPAGVPPVPVAHAGPQLLVEDLRPGSGAEAAPGMTLVVHYTGWLHDPAALGQRGRKFDSSRDRGSPFSFPLGAGRVIRGWDIGLSGLRVGGLRRLVIPPELAYGARDVGGGLIPPNSTLVFEVELLGVESNTLIEGAK